MNDGLSIGSVMIDRADNAVVRDITMHCPRGEITVLLGANGAGKSTLLDGIAGVIPLRSGSVSIDGVDVRRRRRNSPLLAYVEQGRTIFADLTVEENLRAVAPGSSMIDRSLSLFPELRARLDVPTGSLSGGEQQMVVLARAICREPDVILIDEMSQGLAPVIVRRLLPVVRALADTGAAVVLVEQFANLALGVGDRAYIMHVGKIALEADCKTLIEQPALLENAYMRGE